MKKSKFDKFCIFWIWITAIYFGVHLFLAFDRHMYQLPIELALIGAAIFACIGAGLLVYVLDLAEQRMRRHFRKIQREREYKHLSKIWK